jgi:WD40 repeat protein/serine/threonine protein kinase
MTSDEAHASVQLVSDSADQRGSQFDQTMESADSSQLPEAGPHDTAVEPDDPHLSKTLISDEWDNPAVGQTVQSGEIGGSHDGTDFATGPGPDQTSEVDPVDDPSLSKTVQSEEFALEDAVAGRESGADHTVISEQWDDPGVQATLLSDELPQEAIKTMQTMWSGAFEGKTTPGMTVKGRALGTDSGQSSLVIKERSLSAPGEQKAAGAAPEYELLKVLGEGGMGVVYDAKQMSVDRSVAVKMLKPKTAGDEKQRQKFLAEAVVTGELDHPNIVPIYDVGTSERGLLFYSMKKVKGTPWMKLIQQKATHENLEILMKVADAVAFAHSRGVIHRDLKPENVMLGDFGEVLVMDWGLALPAPGYEKSGTISPAHSMGGTPAYMAPEMASGPLEKITFASDVYLMGAILYEILTGRAPHTGKNTMQCLFAAAKNEIRPVDKGGELMDIALKAMATDPKKRYPTIRDFQSALREYSAHIESIALSSHAADELARAEKSEDYIAFSRAAFGFEEALKQWDRNQRARTGISEAKSKHAACALRKGDYNQGISLLDAANPDHQPLLAKLKAAQQERDARQQRLKTMKRAVGTLAALFVVGLSVAVYWINSERDKAVAAEKSAQEQRDAAVKAQAKEEIAKTEAVKQKDKAKEQEKLANIAKDKAIDEEKKANIARAKAEEEQRKAELAKEQEEYEAYIARIGLAAAKIDENAFGSARELLEGCKPELRNWEWGRLMYLCGLSVRSVDGGAPIDSVAYSSDGAKFVTGGWNHAAQIWESGTGKLLRTIPCGGQYVHAVAFSSDGRYVATGGNNPAAYVRIWDAANGEEVKRPDGLSGHTDAVLSVAFSADGKKLLTASFDKTARLWDVETGRELHVFRGHSWWVWSAAFSRDEKYIVTASQDGSAIVWNAATGEKFAQFLGHQGPVYSAAFSPDGTRVATGGYDKRVLVWRPAEVRKFDFARVAQGKEVEPVRFRALEGHGAPVRSVAFSADGSLVVSGSHDNTVKVWDAENGRTLNTFRGHDSWVRSCAFSPDGRTVVSAGYDSRATLWSITDYEEVRVLQGRILQGHNDAVLSASFNRDGKRIVTASRDHSAKTWDFDTGREIQSFEEGHSFLASNAVFFPDGKRLLTSAVDNTVRFWDMTTGTQTGRLDNTGRSAALALSPDGKRILTGNHDRVGGQSGDLVERTAKLWDADSREVVKVLKGHKFEVTAVAFSPDGKWFFTGDANGRGILWNAETLTEVHRLEGHRGKISMAAFLPDSARLVTASNDKTVAQWEVTTGKELVSLVLRHPGAVVSMALVKGARQVLTSSGETASLWDLDKAQIVGALPVNEVTNSVAVSADGHQALTVNSEARTVRLWSLDTYTEIRAPKGNDKLGAYFDLKRTRSLLWTAAFSPEGDMILTLGGSDARLWDVQKASERMSFSPNGIVASAGFSPDGSQIVTGSWDNSARIWDTKNGKDVLKLEGHTRAVNSAVYSPDGSQVLTASDDRTAILWNAATGAVIRTLEGHADRLRSAVFSPDGKQILTASFDKTARLWDAKTGALLGKFEGHKWAVLSAVFSPDGTKIITGSEDNTARIWETATQKHLKSLEGHTAPVASVTFLADPQVPQGTRVLTGSQDNTAKLWDALTGKEILTLKGHSQEVTCVNASQSGRYVLTSSRDGTTVVWLAVDWTKEGPQTARRDGG